MNRIRRVYEGIQMARIRSHVEHVFGPAEIKYGLDEAVVLCLVRNGETWIRDFIEHYQNMGFARIVFLDNGSSDATQEIAHQFQNIIFLKTDVSFKRYNVLLRRFLVERFARNRWSLIVDIDELWVYPYAERVSLAAFLRYVRQSGANAVMAQMLDMCMETLPSEAQPLRAYNRYDISHIRPEPLTSKNAFPGCGFYCKKMLNPDLSFYRGGIRAQVFGIDGIWLTKMPLVFNDKTLEPVAHQHFSNNAVIADMSTILFHYKFTHYFYKQIKDAVENEQYLNNAKEYKQYARYITHQSDLLLTQPSSTQLTHPNQLVDEGIMIVSERYRRFANEV